MRFDSIKQGNNFKESISKLKGKYTANVTLNNENNSVEKKNINATIKPVSVSEFVSGIKTDSLATPPQTTTRKIIDGSNLGEAALHRMNMTQEDIAKHNQESSEWNKKSVPAKVGTVVGKTLATPVAALAQLGTGVATGLEGAMDFGTSAGATGINAARDSRIQTIEKELEKLKSQGKSDSKMAKALEKAKQEAIADRDYSNKVAEEFVGKQWVQDYVGNSVDEFTDEYSYLPAKAGQITKSVGNMLPSIANAGSIAKSLPQATSKVGQLATKGAAMLPFMAQAAGSSTEQALNEGANLADAAKYGLASGAIEGAIESISGGIGGSIGGKVLSSKLGKEAVERIAKKSLGKFALRLADAGIDVAGEGFEEVLSTAINPLIQRMTYDEQAELATSEEMMQSFIDGALSSLLIKGGQAGLSRVANRNNANVQENEAQNQVQTQNIEQTNVIIPNQAEMTQNSNIGQFRDATKLPTQKAQKTLQSAKIAGMPDMDIKKATELNDMLRSGARLNFYDANNIPSNVQADKAKIANGFYKDGTLWINKNSKNKVEQILGHELTHHLETTDSYTDLSNTILDSEVFYDFIAEKGYANVAEYKNKLKEMGYTDAQLDNELVARFVEEKMFTDQKSIDRLARQNTKLVEKIKNWISDLVVSFKGTAQEKELRKIENMYRKALEQARNTTASAETQYSIAGVKAMENINDADLTNAYNEAQRTGKNTRGWFKDKEGNWKFEFSDKDMTLKKNVRLSDKGNRLGDILEHDTLFRAYPELRNTIVNFKEFKTGSGLFDKRDGEITLNKKLFNSQDWKTKVEASLLHEVQHAIQETEGFSGAANPLWSKKAYYETLGEIEAADTKERFLKEKAGTLDRNVTKPRTSEANPKHPRYDNYMQSRGMVDKVKDTIFPYYAGKGAKGYEIAEENILENSKADLRENDNRGLRRYVNDTAGKEPAFSMPEIPKGYTRLYRGLTKEYNKNYDKRKLDNSNGYESWTDNYDLAKAYGDNVYYIDIPTSDIKNDIIDNDSKSETYGDRNLIYFNDKPVGIKGKSGNEYMLYTDHDNYSDIEYKKVEETDKVSFSMPETDNQGRTLSKEQQEFFKDSKVRDENGKLLEVYHGTDAEEFTVFDKELSDEDNVLGQGLYFTADKTQGQKYGSKIYTTYLNIKNPFVIKDLTTHALANEIAKENPNADIIDTDYGVASTTKMTEYLIDNGYDGIKAGENVYVAFEPKQIKNVDNTNPTENPDIRYSMNPVELAKNPPNTKALSRYAQTLQSKHQDIPEQINLIQKEVDNGNFTHEVIHDKRSLNYAQKYIEENGFEDAVNHWNELIKRGKPVDKDELALGQTIYNVAVDNKDTKLVMKMASDLVQEYTEIGRNLQSATLLRKMTPDGRLYALERSVQKINQDLMQKFDDFENIQIPEELADELLRSETQKDMDTAVEKIQEYIASKIPATWQEKLNSWRYLAMLGNPRTHIRNIVGNAVFIPAVEMKNALAQVGELAISKDQRTKAFLGKKDAKLLKYAENDFDKNQETIRGENKYDIKSGVQEKRTIYSNGAIEAARKGNFKLLEAEDTLFLKFRYKKAFAGALKARGITIEQLRENSPETVRKVNEIRSYAINEAQKATYRDASLVASMVSRGKRKLLNAANQSQGAAKLGYNLAYLGAEGVMPFAKTPINIVKRGIEYSPAGLLNGVKNAIFDVKSGKVTAAQAIDKIAAGATGTGIAALGLWLASMGLVSGGEEEKEKEQALKQLKGYQDYSLNVLGKSYTIDWTAPSSIPLFIGVELYNSINSEDESAFLNALSNLAEPVVEMSMLQGLNDTLTTLGEDSALGNIVGKTLTNYLGQYNPTILGQIARSFDPVRRTTYVDKNIPVPAAAQRFIQQQAAKIPGVSRMLPTYKDQFGQEQLTDGVINRIVQNFFSPGYLKDIKEGTVEQGLTELYEKTGETSVIPSYASKSLTHNGEKINLTAKQYDTYAKTRGDLSKKGLEGLFKDNYYKSLSDEQKVKVVEAIYDYAGKIAKTKVIDDYELEFNDKKIQKLQNEGLDFYKYILLKKTADADGNDYTSNDELEKTIKKYGLSRWQKTIKEKNTKSTKTTNTLPTLKQQRAKLPTLKK